MPEPVAPTGTMQPGEWNDSLTGDYLWSNVNFGEAVTEVMTPLTWSVIQFTLDDWVFLPDRPTVGVIGGRPYLNISIFATLFYGIGRTRHDLLDYMASTLYMRLPDEMPIPPIPVSRRTLLRGMVCAVRVQLKQRRGIRALPAYLQANEAWFKDIRAAIESTASESDLHKLWDSEMKSHLKQGVWCVLGSAGYSADYTMRLQRQLVELVGPDDATTLIANLSSRDAPLESLGPLIALDKLSRREISEAAYLESFGHRGPQEFELSAPRPAENSAWLAHEVARFRQTSVDVDRLMQRQRQSFDEAWLRLQRHSPKTANRFGRRLAESARRARLRELGRSAYSRDRWAVRLFAIRAGELSGLADRIFFLRIAEVLSLLSGDRSVTSAIGRRMEAYERYKTLPPYPPVIRGPLDPFAWAADPHRSTDIHDAESPNSPRTESNQVSGAPGSAGVVEGVVHVIADPAEADGLKPGEVLVAVQTDIAWTLLFPRAAAVITDVGAPLSHAAIVARELGIPAVVGCGNATSVLKTGDTVRVDGAKGIVQILGRN